MSGRLGPAFRTALACSFDATGRIIQPTPTPTEGWQPYPADFGAGLGGGYWDNTGFTYSPKALKAYIAANTKETSPEFERRVSSEIDTRERQSSAYFMAHLEGERWSGNVGLPYVRTTVDAQIATPDSEPAHLPAHGARPGAHPLCGLSGRDLHRGRRRRLL